MFTASYYNSQWNSQHGSFSSSGWLDEGDVECYWAPEKKEILPFETPWMDLEGIMLSKMNETEKAKYYMISLIFGI